MSGNARAPPTRARCRPRRLSESCSPTAADSDSLLSPSNQGNFMRAIILAAGRGIRLQQPTEEQLPKCLLRFDGLTLLERHLRLLRKSGVEEVVLALGWRHELVLA